MGRHARKVVCAKCGWRTHRTYRDDEVSGFGTCPARGCGGALKPASLSEEKRVAKAKAELDELKGGGRV